MIELQGPVMRSKMRKWIDIFNVNYHCYYD